MEIVEKIKRLALETLRDHFQVILTGPDLQVTETRPEFKGDFTLVLFGLVKLTKKSPETLGRVLGAALLKEHAGFFESFQVIKGFLNLRLKDEVWIGFLHKNHGAPLFGLRPSRGTKVMVEYSSPNTNKPLHLGHLRNNFLGWSVAAIYEANGYETVKTCIANDRGIHICKSMIAWKRFGQGATPASTGVKGDHFVGDYYVKFGEALKKEEEELKAQGKTAQQAEQEAPLMRQAQQMLVDWEAGDPEVIDLWRTMNGWVYEGFKETYRKIGSDFDKTYYESETYLLGKDLVELGLEKGVFYQQPDGSVWIDLTEDGLDQKIVQRKDGTSVYITQDIGLVIKKFEDFHANLSIYVVADEQNYHFKVLKLIAQKLKLPSADGIHHLSYGLVELPSGRMKTREGTVVDADDLIDEMIAIAGEHTTRLGKVQDFTEAELKELYEIIGMGALKFYLLRVDPKKKMVFNPEESIDFHGFTGPFVQYSYARIQSILRKEGLADQPASEEKSLLPLEKALLVDLEKYEGILAQACEEMNPSLIANFAFSLAKTFNGFYAEHSVSKAENPSKKTLRLQLCELTAAVLKSSMAILGIRVPERM